MAMRLVGVETWRIENRGEKRVWLRWKIGDILVVFRYFLHELTKMQPLQLEKSFLRPTHETSISLTSRTHRAHEILPPPNHRENQEQYFSAFWIKIPPYNALFFLFAFAIFHFVFSPTSSYFLCSSNPCIFCYLFWFVVPFFFLINFFVKHFLIYFGLLYLFSMKFLSIHNF